MRDDRDEMVTTEPRAMEPAAAIYLDYHSDDSY